MAKSKNYFGIRAGSTKSHTFSGYRGDQITKDRVKTVSNPRTMAQTLARMRLSLCSQTAAASRDILTLGFPGTNSYAGAKRQFMRLNNNSKRERPYFYNMYGHNSSGAYNYKFSYPQIIDSNFAYYDTQNERPAPGYRFIDFYDLEDGGLDGLCEILFWSPFFQHKTLVAVMGVNYNNKYRGLMAADMEINVVKVVLPLDESNWDLLQPYDEADYEMSAQYKDIFFQALLFEDLGNGPSGYIFIEPLRNLDVRWFSVYLVDTVQHKTTDTICNKSLLLKDYPNYEEELNKQISSYINH